MDEDMKDVVIGEANRDEIVKEGVVHTVGMHQRLSAARPFKYAFTRKGLWTRNRKSFLVKERSVFVAFSSLECFEEIKIKDTDCCLFHPKSGRVERRFIFDDHEGVVKILNKYMKKRQ
ncbi:MAG: hypothetical protein LBV13_05815 [Methanomassiliicoccaceae archaeon]|jgi:hypothetical protein|nr:hypothetical protein [Methanomassiliicoccaceae archaeon]